MDEQQNVTNVSTESKEFLQMQQVLEILRDIQENERKEMEYAKKQSRFAVLISCICLFLVVLVSVAALTLVPKANILL